MLIHNAEHTFFYIDPSLATSGDGASVATAANAFPQTMNDNTIYLVRRTPIENVASFPDASSGNVTFDGITSVVIMGMPMTTDPEFDSMPEDAKASWVDEEQNYAHITQIGTRYGLIFSSCLNFRMTRICYLSNRSNSSDYDMQAYNSSHGTNCYFENCWFRSKTDYFTTAGNAVDNNYVGERYFSTSSSTSQASQSFYMHKCRIDAAGGYSNAFEIGYQRNIYVDDCEFHGTQGRDDRSFLRWNWDTTTFNTELKATNLRVYCYFSSRQNQYMIRLFTGCAYRHQISNVTIQLGEIQNGSCYSGTRISCAGVIYLRTLTSGSVVENVTANLQGAGTGLDFCIVMLGSYRSSNSSERMVPSRGQYNIVRNVVANFAAEYDEGLYKPADSWDENPSDNTGIINLSVEGYYSYQCACDYLLQNTHITAPMAQAINVDRCMIDMDDCDVQGSCRFSNSIGKIKSITTWYPGYAVSDQNLNTLYIGKITGNRSNPRWEYNSQYACNCGGRSYILIGETNIRAFEQNYSNGYITDFTYGNECNYICTSDQMEGAYFARSPRSKAETWSAYRTGSQSNCSIRLTNETADDRNWPLTIGGLPYKGITQHVTAGDHTLTFYLAMYGYNDYSEITKRFSAVIELPTGEKVFSERGNWSLDEESVWENIDGVTCYKLTIPFYMEEEGDITTSYSWYWYMTDAATFVDPFPTIE